MPIDAWWFRLPRKPSDNPAALMPHAGKGRLVIVVPREDFLQLGYMATTVIIAEHVILASDCSVKRSAGDLLAT